MVETAIARCTSRCAMATGHRLNTSILLAAFHGLSGLFREVSAVEPSLSRPPPPPPPSLISNLASVDVKLCVTRACLLVCHDQLAVAKDISPMARKIVTLNNTKTRSLCQWRWIETISTGSPQRITLTLFTVRDTVWPSAPPPPPLTFLC